MKFREFGEFARKNASYLNGEKKYAEKFLALGPLAFQKHQTHPTRCGQFTMIKTDFKK